MSKKILALCQDGMGYLNMVKESFGEAKRGWRLFPESFLSWVDMAALNEDSRFWNAIWQFDSL